MKKVFLFVLLVGVLFVNSAFSLDASSVESPMKIVSATIDQVVKAVIDLPGAEHATARQAKIREIINGNFDFAEMAKRSLGAYWNEIDASQQKEFVAVFSDLLAKTYLRRIDNIKPGIVTVKSEKIVEEKATVLSTVSDKGDEFPIDYKFYLIDNKWKVYDVVIENIGLVSNYRNEFAGIIRREKFEGLMQRLKDKNAKT